MNNMSYCRFENSYKDLNVCTKHIWDTLSENEHGYRLVLIQLCREIAEEFPDEDSLQSLRWEE
jgi:hypothetical protein